MTWQPQPELLLLQTNSQQKQRHSYLLLEINIKPMPTLGTFDGGDHSGESSSCAGPQTLQGEATKPIVPLRKGSLPPPSLDFVTISTSMPALLSQDKWDVATQWGTFCFVLLLGCAGWAHPWPGVGLSHHAKGLRLGHLVHVTVRGVETLISRGHQWLFACTWREP